ncbi:inositol monophosphatase family protein [Nocardia mangyaensis]|uniref:inositol monophosphatase family protein n=1 Tax=Nocardia mangyaensis TaxID=2213200 RepID=UPI0026770F3F|nr:inositol monophosphatase family protein [Nocardia mangyaensis]MDO3651167.1 inositol monophosphatase family protein [Nocardia mangyaensis]
MDRRARDRAALRRRTRRRAYRDGARIHPLSTPAQVQRLRGAAPIKRMSEHERSRMARIGERFAAWGPGASSAGINYTRILEGILDFVLYQQSRPWDHAPGAILLAEMGGVTIRPDGVPYRLADGRTDLLLTAANRACGRSVRAVVW